MLRHAVVGIGGMGRNHVRIFSEMDGVSLVAVCDQDTDRAKKVAHEHDVEKVYSDFGELLADEDLDSVSIVTPDPSHARLSLQAIEAGKHVFCEKPLATCYADAAKMRDAAESAGVINMVNLSYRNAPALHKVAEYVANGELGTVRHVQAYYLQSWLAQDAWGDFRESPQWLWRLSKAHGSKGVLGDLGVHILDFASLPVGDISGVHCKFQTFEKAPGNKIDEYVFDANDTAIATVEFETGAVGAIHMTRWAPPHRNSLRLNLYGDLGSIELDLDRSIDSFQLARVVDREIQDWETIECPKTPGLMERFVESILTGKNDQPNFARGAVIQKVLDTCEHSASEERLIRIDSLASDSQ